MRTITVRPSDDCLTGIATGIRMAPAKRVHALYDGRFETVAALGMPACGASMGNPSARRVLTSDVVTCPACLAGEVLD